MVIQQNVLTKKKVMAVPENSKTWRKSEADPMEKVCKFQKTNQWTHRVAQDVRYVWHKRNGDTCKHIKNMWRIGSSSSSWASSRGHFAVSIAKNAQQGSPEGRDTKLFWQRHKVPAVWPIACPINFQGNFRHLPVIKTGFMRTYVPIAVEGASIRTTCSPPQAPQKCPFHLSEYNLSSQHRRNKNSSTCCCIQSSWSEFFGGKRSASSQSGTTWVIAVKLF